MNLDEAVTYKLSEKVDRYNIVFLHFKKLSRLLVLLLFLAKDDDNVDVKDSADSGV